MCGIAGVLERDGRAVDAAPLGAMLDAIRHRGPDDDGTWVGGDLALGAVRLSVIDPSARGHQPMRTQDGLGVLAYNGEVYNFRALRAELEDEGARFRSKGDTEVVLEALHRWGPERAVPRFDGMFALAYRDERDGSLWLTRDRLGVKPLVVAEQGATLVFCSEIKGLLAHPAVPRRLDRGRADYFVLYLREDPRASIFEGVRELEPGTLHRLRGSTREIRSFFRLPRDVDVARLTARRGPSAAQACAAVETTLKESVRLHLISDAPVATLCSGGVDSSLVTALARDLVPDLEAYVADVEGEHSEGEAAQRVARHLGSRLHRVSVDRETFLRLWPEAIRQKDLPSTHASDVALLAVTRACRRDGIKVLLTGEGADELFGGYDRYARTRRLWRKARIRSRLPWPFRAPWSRHWRHWRDLAHSGVPARDERWLLRRLTLSVAPAVELRRRVIHEHLADVEPPEDRAWLAHAIDDLEFHLGWILQRHDRMGMASSIETRVPYLENHLIDLALHLPPGLKLRRGRGKWVLKRVAERWLPADVVHAKKRGFPVPGALYRDGARLLPGGFAADLFRWTRAETARILELLREEDATLHHVASLEIWGRLFFGGESAERIAERMLASA